MVVAGGSVWFASGRFTHSGTLVRLDAGSLHLVDKIRFPASVVGVVSTPAGLWVGTARSVVLLDPDTGTVERRVPAGGDVTVLDADPSGRHLYVSTDTPIGHRDHVRFVEMDACSGTVLAAARDVGFAELGGPSGVTAIDGGVCLGTPTGMMGSLTFDREDDLSQIALYRPAGATASAPRSPMTRAGCRTSEEASRAPTPYRAWSEGSWVRPPENLGPTNVVAAAGGLYVGGAEGSIDRILPGSRCIG